MKKLSRLAPLRALTSGGSVFINAYLSVVSLLLLSQLHTRGLGTVAVAVVMLPPLIVLMELIVDAVTWMIRPPQDEIAQATEGLDELNKMAQEMMESVISKHKESKKK